MSVDEFLLARIAEDEDGARAAAPGPWSYSDIESMAGGTIYDPTVSIANVEFDIYPVDGRIRRNRPEQEADATGRHIARHDPARVLADCAAKRAIVKLHAIIWRDIGWLDSDGDQESTEVPVCGLCVPRHSHFRTLADVPHGPCRTKQELATIWAEHPDFDPAWPDTPTSS